MPDAGWGPEGPPRSVEGPVEGVPLDAPSACLLSVAELVPILCAHFNLEPQGRSLVVGFAPGPESIVADSEDPATVIPTLTLCVTHVGVK
jgi:hypothetical protein